MLKKSLISLFIGLTTSYAGMMGPVCVASNITVPCEDHSWEIGSHALYLQPFSSWNSTNRTSYFSNASTSNESKLGATSEYNWGFQLEAARHFGKGKDINLNWYHFRGTTNKTYPAYILAGLNSQTIQQNAAWDHVNLEYGNLINLEETTDIRMHAGLVYARVATQYLRNFSYILPVNPINENYQSAFSGFGARAGMALIYHVMPQLDIHGDIAAGALAGTTKSSSLYNSTGLATKLDTYSISVTAPEIDAKAGIVYKYDFKNDQINLDAGWLWATYINTFGENSERSFGIQGVYFGARWIGDFA